MVMAGICGNFIVDFHVYSVHGWQDSGHEHRETYQHYPNRSK